MGSRTIACKAHPFTVRELRTYGTGKTELLREQVDIFHDVERWDPVDLREALDALADVARGHAEDYTEAVSNMEAGGFSGTDQMNMMTATAEALESWADEVEGIDVEVHTLEAVDLSALDEVPGYGG